MVVAEVRPGDQKAGNEQGHNPLYLLIVKRVGVLDTMHPDPWGQ